MIVLACIGVLVVFPILASQGKGYRGLYFGMAVLALVAGFVTFSITPTDRQVAMVTTTSEKRGAEFMSDHFPNLGGLLVASALGLFVGGLIYRSSTASRAANAPS